MSTAEPKYIKEEMGDSTWIEAMQDELYQFDKLQVWKLVDKQFGKTVIKLKWLWKNIKDEDQTIIRNKARLVSKGYAQKEEGGGLCCTTRWVVDPDHPEKVYRLMKALYGLKQALRAWYDGLLNFLMSKGFTKEYVALSVSCAKVIWMRTHLKDYGYDYNKIPLYCDSQSSIAISCNPMQHSRTKHIHTRYHFMKEHVDRGIIELYIVRTKYQLADMFTSALTEDRFRYLVRRISMKCLTPAELEVLPNESA
nr:retrovirus-related Pol polyprotein from transposon TNT 1-94 [Tanacetum cinerariifolium]